MTVRSNPVIRRLTCALAMSLCSEVKKEKVLRHLINEIESNDFRINTGFLSTPFILPVLVENGYPDIAFRLLEQTESPGWLRNVVLGSTTILEDWNGMEEHRASFNHYSFGAVCSSYSEPLRDKTAFQSTGV